MTVKISRYPQAPWSTLPGYQRTRENYTLDQRKAHRDQLLATQYDVQKETRRALFDLAVPRIDELHFLHPDPSTYREIARTLRRVRLGGWKQALLRATIRDLDLSNEVHWRWIGNYNRLRSYHLRVEHADPDVPLEIPDGIPLGTPTDEERRVFHPETTLWDIEAAAMREIELGMGGPASIVLHDQLTTAATLTIGDFRVPGMTERSAVLSRVGNYLTYYRALRRPADWPEDPDDPLHWGHDARMKTLALAELRTTGTPIRIRPDFDPDTTEYTTNQPIVNATFVNGEVPTFFDPLMTYAKNVRSSYANTHQAQDTLVYTVTANDGRTTRIYRIVAR